MNCLVSDFFYLNMLTRSLYKKNEPFLMVYFMETILLHINSDKGVILIFQHRHQISQTVLSLRARQLTRDVLAGV